MYRLPFIILLLGFTVMGFGQNPHGELIKIDCASCHNPAGWAISSDTFSFNHDTLGFALEGRHQEISCVECHTTLVFENVSNDCINCHDDMHSMSVGNDCARCHNSENWLVDDIPEIHEENGFPLFGAHQGLTCVDCHTSETNLRFDRIGNECINCHLEDFNNTTSPNHIDAGFSMDCTTCHIPDRNEWDTEIVDHSFFPLTKGHDVQDCNQCHLTSNYSETSSECISCHQTDFEQTLDPNHQVLNFDLNCVKCHTTDIGWQPAEFKDHDASYFPIYSGKHQGEWMDCIDCHTNTEDYSLFSCIECHTNPETDNEHDDVNGYVFDDQACLACHPNGEADATFNHDNTNFPLTGEHISVECNSCHISGFEGTSTNCFDCHELDFNSTINPNHNAIGISNECISCHTTDPDWTPASFGVHDDYYPLNGAHAVISNDCVTCHNGDYNNTPNTCIGCHLDDYTNTSNPNHQVAQFSNECLDCHTESAWTPSTFDHDGQYFPIYSGKHDGEWTVCLDCHTQPDDYSIFSCINCHINPETDEEHLGVSGYQYEDNACLACHPTGDADMSFNHDDTNFPLTGSHLNIACLDCHTNGFEGTSPLCVDCHTVDFQGSINPNHLVLNISDDCISCHTTDPDWMPARFDVHNDYYPLLGAHALISDDCVSCHQGDYNNTPNTCYGCHESDFSATSDPNHIASMFSTDCASCHTEDAWTPSTFDHDGQFFPIYSGKHQGEWMECVDCHTNPGDFTLFSCINCHLNPETDESHLGTQGYIYEDNACLACHPTGDADNAFDHNTTGFPLTGVHLDVSCLECHVSGFQNTPSECVDCHQIDFNGSINPNHGGIGIPTDCISCHTTDPDWMPASFAIHDDYYQLNGAHIAIANDCATCHNGDYNNTPNTCFGCHQDDYNATVNPNHQAAQFNIDCVTCHSEDSWLPATFDHDGQYFPIYSGKHDGEWSACIDCHTDPNNYALFKCINCHINPETDEEHEGVGGYIYEDNACLACHPNGEAGMAFDHNTTGFPLEGGHLGVECVDCHNGDYVNTPNECIGCHQTDFNNTTNPSHDPLGISTDCISCHTTDPGWMPATFNVHDDYYPLTGAHIAIADNCIDCHNGDYVNTPNECVGCHQTDFNNSINPNHNTLGIPNDCISCHTTEPDWMPATFDIHDSYYPLNGAHAAISNDCVECHNGDYNNTPNTCIGCHQTDYDGTTNPDHNVAMFPTDCINCHNETAWAPSTWDHDGQYFPIYSGEHDGEWSTCIDCHLNPSDYTQFSCINCHLNPETDDEHVGIGGYIYEDNACLACHPTGEAGQGFDHNSTAFPLDGAHIGIGCIECHSSGYAGTPTDCDACHNMDYLGTSNPNHSALGISTDCISCHTTDPGWMPASFDVHDNYYPLTGAHLPIADNCVDCHNGDYNNTPNDCVGCHQSDFNNSANPNHNSLGISTDCISCHTTDPGWMPATFDIHDNYYPLTGAHLAIADNCIDCHNGDYINTPNECVGCHQTDFNNSVNPNHNTLNIPSDCVSCHTTDPDWMPATFDIHDTYYPLNGAHAAIANDCVDCHNGDYNNTPNTCIGCHQSDYDDTNNPDHASAMFPTDCLECHNETAWLPSTWDHDNQYFPIYDGKHEGEWNQCIDCHTIAGDYSLFSCIDCHEHDNQSEVDDDHSGVGGYMYLSTACYSCHPTGED